MVRENTDPPVVSKGFDHDKGVSLNEELAKAGKSTDETMYPEGEPNKLPIDIRGDAVPEKEA